MTNLRKRQRQEGKEDAWLTTYSDMVTLLLAFFVLLFSFSNLDLAEFERAMLSLQEALGVLQGGRTVTISEPALSEVPPSPPDASDIRHRRQIEAFQIRQLLQARRAVEAELELAGIDVGVSFDLTERGLIIHFTDQVLFASAQADLLPAAREILDVVTSVLVDLPNDVRVEGHTDSRPINTLRFPSNWELSTARSTTVLRHLLAIDDLDPLRLSAAGYGEFRPLATNETPEGRAQNRRVDLVLIRLGGSRMEPSPYETAERSIQ